MAVWSIRRPRRTDVKSEEAPMTNDDILEWADLMDCIEAKNVAEADALFNASKLLRSIIACQGGREERLRILRDFSSPPA